jgi:TetR/AcrR family transcriptional regulator
MKQDNPQARKAKRSAAPADARIRERNEGKILKAAASVFARKGLDGARIAEIAKVAGLPHPNVYYYFRTKEDIYRRLVDLVISDWDRALENISSERDPIEALADYARAKFRLAQTHSIETQLFASEVMTGARFLKKGARTHMRNITKRYADIIDGWIAEGKIAPVNSRHFLVMVWATTEFYAFLEPLVCDALETRKLKPRDFDEAADAFVSVITKALRPDP